MADETTTLIDKTTALVDDAAEKALKLKDDVLAGKANNTQIDLVSKNVVADASICDHPCRKIQSFGSWFYRWRNNCGN